MGEDRHGKLVQHADPWKVIKLVRHQIVLNIDDADFRLYPEPLALDPKKVKDLAKMKQWLPNEFASLYPDPPGSDKDAEMDGDE